MDTATKTEGRAAPWNKGKLLGQKPPLKLKEIWAIRIRLQLRHRTRELALFNLAIDSKLRGCDLVGLHVHDVFQGSRVASRAIVMQKKTQRPVQFEMTEQDTRRGDRLDRLGPPKTGAVPLSEPGVGVPSCVDPAVFPDRRVLGGVDWAGSGNLRHALVRRHQSHTDLPANSESPGRSVIARAHEA